MKADLLIFNIGQLVTAASNGVAKRGVAMLDVGIIKNGAVAVQDGKILAVDEAETLRLAYEADDEIDAGGKVVCPGFVDPHTHIVFAGDRLDEFELKIKGSDYLEILAQGGGINSTVERTREATLEKLLGKAKSRLDKMLDCGTTTCEIKSGYGLDTENELKMLAVCAELDRTQAVSVVPTFLAAHAVPPEHKANSNVYVNLICDTMLSAAWKWFVSSAFHGRVPFFCDVFCENGAFTLEQSRKILETARSLGYSLKAHVDEFANLGGSRMAIELGAVSIDHLDEISEAEIAQLADSKTIGVITPTVNFNFGSSSFADARKLIDSGCALALSTDYNPGSAPCPSQQMAMAIACRYQKLLPAEVFNAVSVNAAFAIGLGKSTGSIEVGKRADLLVLDTNDFREAAYEFGGNIVSTVLKNGKVVSGQ